MENGVTNELRESSGKVEKAPDERKPLKLYSPGGGAPFIYSFNKPDNQPEALDILDLIRSVLHDYPQIGNVISNFCKLEEVDVHSYSTMRSLCKKFNKAVHHMIKSGTAPALSPMSRQMLHHVVTRCYNKAVENEKALNKHYEAFSSQTYGETSYDRMQMILDEIQPTKDDVFVDLGSGVGQIVVHVAGSNQVKKAVGIEIAQLPSCFAKVLGNEFTRHVEWYGKMCSPFQLEQGDFLDEKYRELITQEATIIFINNYAFQSDLETRIKMELLRELKDGTRIITTKPYVPLNKNSVITDRQMNDISVIIDITELKECPNPCSWTSNNVPYYMHVINRAKLERYFLSRNPALRARSNDRRSSTPSSKNSNSRESSVGLKESKNGHRSNGTSDEIGFGPTTRRKWQEYVSELDQMKTKKTGDPVAPSPKPSSESTHFPPDVFSDSKDEDSEDSMPVRKKQRRSVDKKKDKTFRGRPRKPDGGHKNSPMSMDAKEGIELMHQITKAVSSGNQADTSVILADLTNQIQGDDVTMSDSPAKSASSTVNFPVPGLSERQSIAESSLNILRCWRSGARKLNENEDIASSKYPSLNKFLLELRNLYENFLDTMQTPEFVQNLTEKINAEKAKKSAESTPVRAADIATTNLETAVPSIADTKIGGDDFSPSTKIRFARHLKRLSDMRKDIAAKSKDLNYAIAKYNAEMDKFALDVQQEFESESSGGASSFPAEEMQRVFPSESFQKQSTAADSMIPSDNLIVPLSCQQQQTTSEPVQESQQFLSQPSSSSLFPVASGIEQLMMSDLVHNYSQQQQQQQMPQHSVPNNPLLAQLTQILAAPRISQDSPSALISPISTDIPAIQSPLLNTISARSEVGHNTIQSDALSKPSNILLSKPELASAFSTSKAQQALINIAPNMSQLANSQQLLNFLMSTNATQNFIHKEMQSGQNSVGDESMVLNDAYSNQQTDYNRKLRDMITALSPSFLQGNQQATQSIHQQQSQMSNVSMDSDMAMASTSSGTATTVDNQSTVAAVVAAVAAGSMRKGRPKPTRPSQCSKRNTKQVSDDPEKEEQMQRQIQDIVEKALLVDHAAKQSEKERKARSFERRRDKCSASLSIATPNYAGTSANVSANYSASTITKKRNSGDTYSGGSNNFELLSPISTNAANSSFGGSASNSAISSPVAQNFASSAASACAQLLSSANNNIGLPLKQPISIVSVAPPPHSPPIGVNMSSISIDASTEVNYNNKSDSNDDSGQSLSTATIADISGVWQMNFSSGNNISGKRLEKAAQNDNKRKRPANYTKQPAKKSPKCNISSTMATPFDSILNEIEAFDSVNRKRDSSRLKHEIKSEEGSPPCSSKQLPPSIPNSNSSLKPVLTKSELMRGEGDTKILHSILNKDGLMERILGYKMIRGRVESCSTIRNLIDLDNCVSPEYEDVEDVEPIERRYPAVPFRDVPSTPRCQGSPALANQTPASSEKMASSAGRYDKSLAPMHEQNEPRRGRGPKTPPGSPPRANRSRSASICSSASSAPPVNEDAMASAISDDENADMCVQKKPRLGSTMCTPLPPPPAFPEIRERKSHHQNHGKTRSKPASSSNGNAEDAETLLRQFSEVTNTSVSQLREYIGEDLQAAMSRIDRSVLLSTLKNALKNVTVDTTPPPPVPHNNYHQQSQTRHVNNENEADITGDGCEMEISNSEQSIGKPSAEGSSQLLPPPPPPVISPPPPPPPLFGTQAKAEVQPSSTLPTINLCVPPPQVPSAGPQAAKLSIPPPIISAPNQTTSFMPRVPPPPLSSIATALPSSSFGMPPPAISTTSINAQPPKNVIRVDLTQKRGHPPPSSSNANVQTNLSQPAPMKIVVNLSAQLKNQGTPSTPAQRPPRARPTPTVNMDFIKSRPPPPIPEILRKNTTNTDTNTTSSQYNPAVPPKEISQPIPLFKAQVPAPLIPPTTISTVDLTKLVKTSAPLKTTVPPQNLQPTLTPVDSPSASNSMAYLIPNVPPPAFNKFTSDSTSRPTSRLSGPLQLCTPRVNSPPLKVGLHKSSESTNTPHSTIRNSLLANFPPNSESTPRSSTSFHGSHKQPLLPSPAGPAPGIDEGVNKEPAQRRTLIPPTNEKNIFKTLMSALSTTAAAAAIAQALPQYTNPSHHQQSSRLPQPSQSQPNMDAILANVFSGATPNNNSTPKFNFANLSQQDLNSSIATFVRALTSGAAKNTLGQSKFPARNTQYPPPRSS